MLEHSHEPGQMERLAAALQVTGHARKKAFRFAHPLGGLVPFWRADERRLPMKPRQAFVTVFSGGRQYRPQLGKFVLQALRVDALRYMVQ